MLIQKVRFPFQEEAVFQVSISFQEALEVLFSFQIKVLYTCMSRYIHEQSRI